MYKLLCSNLTKSQKSLTNFTGYYRRVARKYYESAVTGKKHDSETDLRNPQATEEKSEPPECQEETVENEVSSEAKRKLYASLLRQKIVAKARLCPSPKESEKRMFAATSVPSRLFHSAPAYNKQNNPQVKKPFRSKEAQEYYQTAIEQCMRIKYKLNKHYQQASYAVQAPKLASELKREFENIASSKKIESLKLNVSKQKEAKHEQAVAPELTKIAHMKSEKENNQFKQANFRITYPTHTVRYKLGTYKLQHKIKQQVVSNNELKTILRDPIKEPFESLKVKHRQTSEREKAKVQELKYKLHQKRLPYIAHYLQQYGGEENTEEAKKQKKQDQAKIRQHPTVRPANPAAKMTFKTSYNKLLKKSGLVYQGPKAKLNDADDEKKRNDKAAKGGDGRRRYDLKTPPPAPDPPTWTYAMDDDTKQTNTEPKVMEHPLAGTQPVIIEAVPIHPKRILSDKSEIFDIDAMCLKSNTASNVTTNYGDYVVESDERVRHFVETCKQESKMPRSEPKFKTEAEESKHEAREGGTGNVESINEYLKKLKDLRDKTAIDRPRLRKLVEPKKLDMVQKVEGRKIRDATRRSEERVEKLPSETEIYQTAKAFPKRKPPFTAAGENQTTTEMEETRPGVHITVDDTVAQNKQYPISDKFGASTDTGLHPNKNEDVAKDRIVRRLRHQEEKVRSQSVLGLRKEKGPVKRVSSLNITRTDSFPKRVTSRSPSPKDNRPLDMSVTTNLNIMENEDDQEELKNRRDTLSMIMEQYMVQSKEAISMAELKRINRRKRREREKRLMEQVKTQQRKFEENERDAMMEGNKTVTEDVERNEKLDVEPNSVNVLKGEGITAGDESKEITEWVVGNMLQVTEKMKTLKEASNENFENASDKVPSKDFYNIPKDNANKLGAVSEEKENPGKHTSTADETNLKAYVPSLLKERNVLEDKQESLEKLSRVALNEEKTQAMENTEKAVIEPTDEKEAYGLKDDVSKVTDTKDVSVDIKEKATSENLGKPSDIVPKEPKVEKQFGKALEKVNDMKKSFEEKKETLLKLVNTALQQKKEKVSATEATDNRITKEKEKNVGKEGSEKPRKYYLNANEENKSEGEKMKDVNVLKEEKVLENLKKSIKERNENIRKLVNTVLENNEKPLLKVEAKKPTSIVPKEKEVSQKLMKREKEKYSEIYFKKYAKIVDTGKEATSEDNLALEKVALQKKALIALNQNVKKSLGAALEQKVPQVLEGGGKAAIKESGQKESKSLGAAPEQKVPQVLERGGKKERKGIKYRLEKSPINVPEEKVQPVADINLKKSTEKRPDANLNTNLLTETHESKLPDKVQEDEKTTDAVVVSQQIKRKISKEKWPGGFKSFKQRTTDGKTAADNEPQHLESITTAEKRMKEELYKAQLENLRKLKEASTKIVKLVEKFDDVKLVTEKMVEKSTIPDNRPTIRKEKPEPKRDKQKREQPKSKPDIVLPPKGQNEPKMKQATENGYFEELKRDIIEEINKELRNSNLQKQGLVSMDKIKKSKSLADLAAEQKAKILKEIETSWNEENAKTRKKYVLSKSETRLNSMEAKKDLTLTENVKENAQQKKTPLLIIKLRYPSLSAKSTDNKTEMLKYENVQMSKKVDEELKNRTSGVSPNPDTIKRLKANMEGLSTLPQYQKQISTNGKELIVSPVAISYTPQLGTSSPCLYFSKKKRARIEDDVSKVEFMPKTNMRFMPKDVLWHTQDDLDVCFSKLKRGRIEDDNPNQLETRNDERVREVPRARSGSHVDMSKSSKNLSLNITPSLKEIKWYGPDADLWKTTSADVTPIQKSFVPIKGIHGLLENSKFAIKTLDQAGKIRQGAEKIVSTKLQENVMGTRSKTTQEAPVRPMKPKKCKVPIKKKQIRSISQVELKKGHSKTFESKSKTTSSLITGGRSSKTKSAQLTDKKNSKKRDNTEKVSDPKILTNNDFKTRKNIKKLIQAMKKADRELEEILKSYQIFKKPTESTTEKKIDNKPKSKEQGVKLKRECTQVVNKRAKTRESIYKNSIDSKTYVVKKNVSKMGKIKTEILSGTPDKKSKLKSKSKASDILSVQHLVINENKPKPNETTNKHHKYLLTADDRKLPKGAKVKQKETKKKVTHNKTKTMKTPPASLDVKQRTSQEIKMKNEGQHIETSDTAKTSITVEERSVTEKAEPTVANKEKLTAKTADRTKKMRSAGKKENAVMNKEKLTSEVLNHVKRVCGKNSSDKTCNKLMESGSREPDDRNGPPHNDGGGVTSEKIPERKLLLNLLSRESGNKIVATSSYIREEDEEELVETAEINQKEDVEVPGKRTTNLNVATAREFQVSIPKDTTLHDTSTPKVTKKSRSNKKHKDRGTSLALSEIKEEEQEGDMIPSKPQLDKIMTEITKVSKKTDEYNKQENRDSKEEKKKKKKKKARFTFSRSTLIDMIIKPIKKRTTAREEKSLQTIFVNKKMANTSKHIKNLSLATSKPSKEFDYKNENSTNFKSRKHNHDYFMKPTAKSSYERKNETKHNLKSATSKNTATTHLSSNTDTKGKMLGIGHDKSIETPSRVNIDKEEVLELSQTIRQNISRSRNMLEKQLEVLKAANVPTRAKIPPEETMQLNKICEIHYGGGKERKMLALLNKKLTREVGKMLVQDKSMSDLDNEELKKMPLRPDPTDDQSHDKILRESEERTISKRIETNNEIEDTMHIQTDFRNLSQINDRISKMRNGYLGNTYKKIKRLLVIVNEENKMLKQKNALQEKWKGNRKGKQDGDHTSTEMDLTGGHISKINKGLEKIDEINKENLKLEISRANKTNEIDVGQMEMKNTGDFVKKTAQSKSSENLRTVKQELGSLSWSEKRVKSEIRKEFEKIGYKRFEQNRDGRKLIESQSDIITREKTADASSIDRKSEKKNKKGASESHDLTNTLRSTDNIKQDNKWNLALDKLENDEKTEKLKETPQKTATRDTKSEKTFVQEKKDDTVKQKLSNIKVQSYVKLIPYRSQDNVQYAISKETRLKSITEPCLTKFDSQSIKNKTSRNEQNNYQSIHRRMRQTLTDKKMQKTQKDKIKEPPHATEQKADSQNVKNKYGNGSDIQSESKQNAIQGIGNSKGHLGKCDKLEKNQEEAYGKDVSTSVSIQNENETLTEKGDVSEHGYLSRQTSWEELREKIQMEAKLRKIFRFWLMHKGYFKNKYSKNQMNDFTQAPEVLFKQMQDAQLFLAPTQNQNSDVHLTPSRTPQKEKDDTETNETTTNHDDTVRAEIQPQQNEENQDMKYENGTMETCETVDNLSENRTMEEYKINNVENTSLVPTNVKKTIATPENQSTTFVPRKIRHDEFESERKAVPLKARIEEIFDKQRKVDDKIYRFNKNLLKHIKQKSEKTPQVVQKQGVVPLSKALLDPRMLDIYEMQKTLYKYLATELRKPYHERATGFSLLKKHNRCTSPAYYSTDEDERFIGQQQNEERPKEILKGPYYIEKSPPNRYEDKKPEEPPKPVIRSCDTLCLPSKNISQVALKSPIEEATTLNQAQSEKVSVVPKSEGNVLDKYKSLKITQLNIRRQRRRTDENFLPMAFRLNKNNTKTQETRSTYEEARKQILQFRYELLRKLHNDFDATYQKDINRNVGRFERVSKYYKSVTEKLEKGGDEEIAVVRKSKSMEEMLGPCPRPSFENVSRYYNSVIVKNKKTSKNEANGDDVKKAAAKATGGDKLNSTENLIKKLPQETTELDKKRNNFEGTELALTKGVKKEDDQGNDPTNSGNQN